MTIHWHFEESRREVDGGVQLPGARMGDAIQTPNSNSVAVTPLTSRRGRFNSGAKDRQPFLDDRELLACLPLLFILLTSALIVFASAFVYALLVPQPI